MLLTKEFLSRYENKEPEFLFGDLSEYIYLSKYSRLRAGEKETWQQVIQRNVEGLFRILEKYNPHHAYTKKQLKHYAERMYEHMFNMRFLPAGRPLANIGTPIIDDKELGAAANNCAFISFRATETVMEGFDFILDMSMLGVGVGIDVGVNVNKPIYKPVIEGHSGVMMHKIGDSREGWVIALNKLITSYYYPDHLIVAFDYSGIRKEGEPIRGMGGIHAGYKPLKNMMDSIRKILDQADYFDSRVLADISNIIGTCVISGGQRRTALLLLGKYNDNKFMTLKDYETNPERSSFGWTSNNSPYLEKGQSYKELAERIVRGEDIGAVWMENFKDFGRMNEYNTNDYAVGGVNPCAEIGLEPFELCNLIEFNPNRTSTDYADYSLEVLELAVLYAKILSTLPTHWSKTNDVMQRNRRFGISQTGIVEYIEKVGLEYYRKELNKWYKEVKKYDIKHSDKLRVNISIRRTTVKPSGTISKLMGTSAGVHYATSKYLIRRVRTDKNSGFAEYYRQKGYYTEPDLYDKNGNTMVIEFPITYGNVPTLKDVSMYDQANLAAFMQEHWADNAVSVTVTFKEEEGKYMSNLLEQMQYKVKVLSFLKHNPTQYEQLPEEEITEEQYNRELIAIKLRAIENGKVTLVDASPDKFCTTDTCEIIYK